MLYDVKEVTDSLHKEWDSPDFVVPEGYALDESSSLADALTVLYKAGGYDFFRVAEPGRYPSPWLNFVGGLEQDIEDGKYQPDGSPFVHPLTEEQRAGLRAHRVPEIFL